MRKIEVSYKMPNFSNFLSNVNFLVFGLTFLIMLIFAVIFGGEVYSTYAQAKENEQKIIEMNNYIADWMEKSSVVNNARMHPVKLEELDKVQTVLLTSLKQYGLNITGFQAEKPPVIPQTSEPGSNGQNSAPAQPPQNNYHDYELNVEGSYSSVVNFLNSIHNNNILIGIRNLKIYQSQGMIKLELKYRVYTK